jgi:hypothetical protein
MASFSTEVFGDIHWIIGWSIPLASILYPRLFISHALHPGLSSAGGLAGRPSNYKFHFNFLTICLKIKKINEEYIFSYYPGELPMAIITINPTMPLTIVLAKDRDHDYIEPFKIRMLQSFSVLFTLN